MKHPISILEKELKSISSHKKDLTKKIYSCYNETSLHHLQSNYMTLNIKEAEVKKAIEVLLS